MRDTVPCCAGYRAFCDTTRCGVFVGLSAFDADGKPKEYLLQVCIVKGFEPYLDE